MSLVELLVATAITSIVTVLACSLAIDAQRVARADGARLDLQQRARVATDRIGLALREAGAGPSFGVAKGALSRIVPPVIPRRIGRRGADPPTSVRGDAWTTIAVAADIEPATLALPAPAGAAAIELAAGCLLRSCGFAPGSQLLLLDAIGHYDLFSVLAAVDGSLTLRHHGPGSATSYPTGSPVLPVIVSTVFLDGESQILRTYDGDASDLPFLDDVVAVEARYYGDKKGPRTPRPPSGVANCLYESDGSYRSALLPLLEGPGASEAPLTADVLTDGPWCGAGANQFDADVLRLRRVRIAIRLQASDPSVRGADPSRFQRPGHARHSASEVPDVTVVIDVTLRNQPGSW
jgi:hypothetical protein